MVSTSLSFCEFVFLSVCACLCMCGRRDLFALHFAVTHDCFASVETRKPKLFDFHSIQTYTDSLILPFGILSMTVFPFFFRKPVNVCVCLFRTWFSPSFHPLPASSAPFTCCLFIYSISTQRIAFSWKEYVRHTSLSRLILPVNIFPLVFSRDNHCYYFYSFTGMILALWGYIREEQVKGSGMNSCCSCASSGFAAGFSRGKEVRERKIESAIEYVRLRFGRYLKTGTVFQRISETRTGSYVCSTQWITLRCESATLFLIPPTLLCVCIATCMSRIKHSVARFGMHPSSSFDMLYSQMQEFAGKVGGKEDGSIDHHSCLPQRLLLLSEKRCQGVRGVEC